MPTWTSSLTTMLIDGAPIPLVAQTDRRPAGQAGDERVEAAVAGQRPSARRGARWRSARSEPGSPLSSAIGVPSGRSSARTRCGTAGPHCVIGTRPVRRLRLARCASRSPTERRTLIPMSDQIPLVDYLVLGDEPHLVANECTSCGARFFDRRNACAACFGTDFEHVDGGHRGHRQHVHDRRLRRAGHPRPVRVGSRRLRRHAGARQPDQRRARPRPRDARA